MEYEKYKFRVGEIEYDVIHCLGHGQCQCDSCKQRGRYNVSWTSWFYKFKETDEHVLCSDCMTEALVQQRINAETERLTGEFKTDYKNSWKNKFLKERAKNAELEKQIAYLQRKLDSTGTTYRSKL